MIKMLETIMGSVTIGASMLSVIFSLGVVWRVEKELDISFKLFSCSIIAFLLGELIDFFKIDTQLPADLVSTTLKLLFAIFFLMGILAMRDLIRKMDGEKDPEAIKDEALKNNPQR